MKQIPRLNKYIYLHFLICLFYLNYLESDSNSICIYINHRKIAKDCFHWRSFKKFKNVTKNCPNDQLSEKKKTEDFIRKRHRNHKFILFSLRRYVRNLRSIRILRKTCQYHGLDYYRKIGLNDQNWRSYKHFNTHFCIHV